MTDDPRGLPAVRVVIPAAQLQDDIASLQRFRQALREVSREIARDKRRALLGRCAIVGAWFAAGCVVGAGAIVAMHAVGLLK